MKLLTEMGEVGGDVYTCIVKRSRKYKTLLTETANKPVLQLVT